MILSELALENLNVKDCAATMAQLGVMAAPGILQFPSINTHVFESDPSEIIVLRY